MTDGIRIDDQRIERIDLEIERLDQQIQALDRDWRNAKHTLWLGALGIPAFFVAGYLAMVLVVVFTFCLYASALYLIGVRRREYVGLIEDCQKDKGRIRRRMASA
jgi:hypothetical protein